jgi:opacity protein-like surface antigen
MSILSRRLGLALALAALCPGVQTAHAQAAPLSYWAPGWIGFGGNLNAGPNSNTYGNFAGFNGSDAGGSSYPRYNFSNGWFVGGEGGSMGLNGFTGTSSNFPSLSYQGTQFGYNFQNAPLTVYGGLDTIKYNPGNFGSLAAFDSTSNSLSGYSAHVGVEFKPTSNVSLSLGVGYTQQPSINSDISSLAASPFAFGARH